MNKYSLLIDVGGSFVKSSVSNGIELLNLLITRTPPLLNNVRNLMTLSTSALKRELDYHYDQQTKEYGEPDKIIVSGQMGCFTLQDSNHRFFSDKIFSWQNNASDLEFARIEMDFNRRGCHQKTGEKLFRGIPLVTLRSLQDEFGNFRGQFTSLIQLTASHFAGFTMPSHITDAASSGLFDIRTNEWMNNSWELSNIDFPDVVDQVNSCNSRRNSNSKVFVGIGDQQASLFGVDMDDDEIIVNIGTGGQVATLSTSNTALEGIQQRPYFNGGSITTVTHLPSGRLLNSAVKVVAGGIEREHFAMFERIANQVVQEVDRIREYDLRIPHHIFDSRRFIVTFVHSFARAYCVEIRKIMNSKTKIIKFAGGVGQKFTALQRLIQAEIGLEIEVSQSTETTLEGLRKLLLRN